MREGRLFGILYYILDKGHVTAAELAERFEVSVRTIYRDVDALSSVGIPIYVTTGRNGGIQFLDEFVLDKCFLSDVERQEILSCLQSFSAVQYPGGSGTLKKLSSIFQLGLADWIEVDFSRWGSIAENENLLFQNLRKAIFKKQQVSFDYFNSFGGKGSRKVWPLKLVYKDKAWYLYGFCLFQHDCRLFRLTRVKDLILTDICFEYSMDSEREIFLQPQDMGDLVDLELNFSLDVGYRLFDTFDDNAIIVHDKGYTVIVTLPENEWLYDFLLSFGNEVTIIRPQSLRQAVIERYELALRHHRGGCDEH